MIEKELEVAISPARMDADDQIALINRWTVEDTIKELKRLRAALKRRDTELKKLKQQYRYF